jgi:hypothetical protein
VECFTADFPGECPEGAEMAAERLGPILNIRFPNDTKPKIVMTDKGRGFFNGWTSAITQEYKDGLRSVGLRAFMGEDARNQPGTLQDLMLHETGVSWMRSKMQTSCPPRPWQETREDYKARLQEASCVRTCVRRYVRTYVRTHVRT